MFIACKATGHKNYACGLLETVLQAKILPQQLRNALVHQRFANRRGEPDSNIPIDLLMEQENRTFKEQLHTYRGEYSQHHLNNISLGSNLRDAAVRNIDRQTGYYISKGEGAPAIDKDDIRLLVAKYRNENLFEDKPCRSHCSSLAFLSKNPMVTMTSPELDKWIKGRISILKTKNVYKQFDDPSSSVDFALQCCTSVDTWP